MWQVKKSMYYTTTKTTVIQQNPLMINKLFNNNKLQSLWTSGVHTRQKQLHKIRNLIIRYMSWSNRVAKFCFPKTVPAFALTDPHLIRYYNHNRFSMTWQYKFSKVHNTIYPNFYMTKYRKNINFRKNFKKNWTRKL
jgi:hypothetical protein